MSAVAVNSPSPLLIAQITDTHLYADAQKELLGLQTSQSFQCVIEQVNALEQRPDLILLTGDLSQDGTAESYERLHTMVSPLAIPTYWLPGNHDCPKTMAQVLTRSPISPQKSFYADPWHIVLLDSSVPGCVHGYLSPESLEWLDQELRQSNDAPALIAFHHPPFLSGSDWMNDIGLLNAEEFFEVCDRHSHVKLVLFGHIHQNFSHQRNQVHYLGTPSTCIQFKPNSVNFALDEEQPGLRLVTLYPDGKWESEVERVVYSCKLDFAAAGY
ncbi:3',5'-cyclic-AMP phosphodiesterase [Phormidium sp. CLA17]|uniref:3',5'-cyclic-AMP phosphodiesterase n=1 Tax=Leptolyngbya sp. Cla-17 TaxID=2803751 RepID=UPI0014918C57|nr:3',5'-cyclic-AMP phosphodiesterase [Leptolyngbya sp. Cla-17]MBM0741948.1 3',5'-cyclic-AMP phosphodiesterase [Leptolyngbya sp. Cla-17]